MLKIGDRLICKPKDMPETEHCIRAIVIKVENGNVTVSRSLKFGTLPMERNLTLPEAELLKYYTPVKERVLQSKNIRSDTNELQLDNTECF